MVQDPMFSGGENKAESPEAPDNKEDLMHREAGNIPQTTLKKADLEPKEEEPPKEKPEAEPEANPEPDTKDVTEQTQDKLDEIEAAKQAEHDQTIQKMIDSKDYALPITNTEKRRSRRVVIFGAVLSIILLLAWVDIALDAGILHISGIKPVTHFFSN
jgi:hypothetical protein